ncbi:hypothetical protein ACFL07_00340 [Pseudomonadota bacterium]
MSIPKITLISILLLLTTAVHSDNSWVISESVDPMTDKIIRTATQAVTPVTGTQSEKVTLVLRCTLTKKSRDRIKGKLEIYFNWDEVINVERLGSLTYIHVQTRFDDDKMKGKNWAPGNDFQSSFVRDIHNVFNWSGEQKAFLREMLDADKLIVRVVAAFDAHITATFDLSGLETEAASVLEYCN